MDFGEAVRQFYGNYTNADGRAQRAAYWYVLLYQLIIYAVLLTVIFMADGGNQLWEVIQMRLDGDVDATIADDFGLGISGVIGILILFGFAIANILPDIMLGIRRFHDLDQTGWFVLIFKILGIIPIVGHIANVANLIWFAMPGTEGPNKYGPDPLGRGPDIFG